MLIHLSKVGTTAKGGGLAALKARSSDDRNRLLKGELNRIMPLKGAFNLSID